MTWRPLGLLTFSLVESLRLQRFGRGDPSAYVDHERYTKAAWTPLGPAVLDVAQNDNGQAGYRLFGPGAAHLEARLPDLLGLSDPGPPESLTDDRRLGPIADGLRLLRLTASINPLETHAALILQQRVTFTEAARSFRLFCERLAKKLGPAPKLPDSPPLDLPPRPEDWLALSQPEARALGIDAQRWRYLKVAAENARHLAPLMTLPLAEARSHLERVAPHLPGLGPWTTAFLRGLGLADPDALPTGDVHLPHDVAKLLTGIPVGSDEQMLTLLAPFSGHRFRVVRALVADVRRRP